MNPVKAIAMIHEKFGASWVNSSEPESIAICIGDNFPISEDMINAIKTCIVSDLPWADPFVFENVVDGLCGNPVLADTLTTPPLEEICVAVYAMSAIKPDNEYSDDVMKYICSCAMAYGLVWLPQSLLFAAEYMADTDTGLQLMVKTSIEASGWPVYDYPYTEDPVGVQLAKLASIQAAFEQLISD